MNKNIQEMLNIVMGDTSLVSQMLDGNALSDYEMRDVAMRITEKLGRDNVRPEFVVRALRNVRVA